MVGKARKPYPAHAREADSVMAGTRRAYRDAAIRTQNQASMRYWEALLDSSQGSLAGTLRAWRYSDTLPAEEIARAKKRIAADFDAITRLESDKAK